MWTSDFFNYIETLAEPALAASWDACGVQVAARRDDTRLLAVALDPTSLIVDQAVALGADCLLTHHPLALRPALPRRLGEFHSVLSSCLGADMWLYAAHTTLDSVPEGPAGWLARRLGLKDLGVLEPAPSSRPDRLRGIGQIGRLPAPMGADAFLSALGPALGLSDCAVVGRLPDIVRTVAICPGSGGSLAERALALGADVLVTGDVKHHAALDALGLGLCILDVGHFVLEERMMRVWADELAQQLSSHGVKVSFISGQDPIKRIDLAGS